MTNPDKEKEKRERTKESKVKESPSLTRTTRTREELQKLARSIPTLEQVKTLAHDTLGFTDDAFICDWYRQMNASFWCDESGQLIRNWGWVFNKWRLNRKLFDRLRDPARIADERKERGTSPRKADNWRGTRPEEVGDVLG